MLNKVELKKRLEKNDMWKQIANLNENINKLMNLKKDSYRDPYQHQQPKGRLEVVSYEMMPIYRVLQEILDELKQLNAK